MLRISDAATLGLHAMFLLACATDKVSVEHLATTLNVSKAHLGKVMQRLARHNLVSSRRGPKGGFYLGENGQSITLLQIYEAIDGPFVTHFCLLGRPTCALGGCLLGNVFEDIRGRTKAYLAQTTLEELAASINAAYDGQFERLFAGLGPAPSPKQQA